MRRVYQEQQAGEAQHVDDGDVGGDCVQVLLVAGGGEVRTAELLQVGGREATRWQEVTPTPRRTFVLHGVTINNTVFMMGGLVGQEIFIVAKATLEIEGHGH